PTHNSFKLHFLELLSSRSLASSFFHISPACDILSTSKKAKHTAVGIPTWSPTVVLIHRFTA
ncbi:hypothetical protein M433DRAFT_92481, partial [Acidomyces richmondensis BFW]